VFVSYDRLRPVANSAGLSVACSFTKAIHKAFQEHQRERPISQDIQLPQEATDEKPLTGALSAAKEKCLETLWLV
jgi:hypothetical protein